MESSVLSLDSESSSGSVSRSIRNKKIKALGTTIDIEQTGTEDIPSCRSFTVLGLISVIFIIVVIMVIMEKARHYIPVDRMGYLTENSTLNTTLAPSPTPVFFIFTDPRFTLAG